MRDMAGPISWLSMIYVTNRKARTLLLPKLEEMFMKLEGVDRAIDQTEFLQLGMPLPHVNQQMADLALSAKDGCAFPGPVEGDPVRTLRRPAEAMATLQATRK